SEVTQGARRRYGCRREGRRPGRVRYGRIDLRAAGENGRQAHQRAESAQPHDPISFRRSLAARLTWRLTALVPWLCVPAFQRVCSEQRFLDENDSAGRSARREPNCDGVSTRTIGSVQHRASVGGEVRCRAETDGKGWKGWRGLKGGRG